ncbi:MAG TPA: hypothetical protein VMJ10_11495 [Kofleriaceae bacterium]|nr:hypothetical protein [Kofleriaceae bacterium]
MSTAASWLRAGVIAGAGVAACHFTPGNPLGGGGDARPIEDAGCPDAVATCDGDVLVTTCDGGSGSQLGSETCPWGCTLTAGPHCEQLVPSGGGLLLGDVAAGSNLTTTSLGSDLFVDGDTGAIGSAGNPTSVRGSGSGVMNGIDFEERDPIAMFRFASLGVIGTVHLVGTHPIALVADGEISIGSTLDVTGSCANSAPGPGGFAGGSAAGADGSGSGGGTGAAAASLAGGGGGFGGTGGGGANGASAAQHQAGGVVYGDPTLALLVGGGGGAAGGGGATFGPGGGGGGAVQLESNTSVVIGNQGVINAGGCGGVSGTMTNNGGGGGGAGGAILIEAPLVTVMGTLAVNGGGGGGGGTTTASAGQSGQPSQAAAMGTSGGAGTAAGGNGASNMMADGMNGGNMAMQAAGGGGGVGRIRLNTRNNMGLSPTGSVLSPPLMSGTTTTAGSAAVR